MKSLITIAALTAAVLTVLGSRIVVPAFILLFRSIEEGFAPAADTDVLIAALPVEVSEPIEQRQDKSANQTNRDTTPAPRKARRRKPSAKTLAAIEAIA